MNNDDEITQTLKMTTSNAVYHLYLELFLSFPTHYS